jgi:hypothetical protein
MKNSVLKEIYLVYNINNRRITEDCHIPTIFRYVQKGGSAVETLKCSGETTDVH